MEKKSYLYTIHKTANKLTFQQILKDVKKKKFSPIYLLHGDEPYFIDRLTEAIEQNALMEHEKAFNQDVIYGKDIDLPRLKSYLMQYPAMAERRVVIIKEAADFKGFKDLKAYWAKPNPATVFVIAHKYKKFGAGLKAIGKVGVVFESKKVYDNKLPAWISDYLKSKKRDIKPNTSVLLAEYLGNDLSKITNELEKIHLNIPEGTAIDNDIVEKYIGISKEYNVFELQDALSARNHEKAMRIAYNLSANIHKQPLILILASLFGYFSKIYIAHKNKSKHDPELAKALGLRFQFHVKNYRRAMQAFPLVEVHRCMALLREYDLKAKGLDNASATHGELLEELIFKTLNPVAHAY